VAVQSHFSRFDHCGIIGNHGHMIAPITSHRKYPPVGPLCPYRVGQPRLLPAAMFSYFISSLSSLAVAALISNSACAAEDYTRHVHPFVGTEGRLFWHTLRPV
jgi:hypothetical protein